MYPIEIKAWECQGKFNPIYSRYIINKYIGYFKIIFFHKTLPIL